MSARTTLPLAGSAPISAAVRWRDLVFVSGLAAIDPETMALTAPDIAGQSGTVLDQLAVVLDRAGSNLQHVLRLECFLADPQDVGAWNEVFAKRFPADPPARTTVVVGFVVPGMLIEVQAVAAVPT